METAELIPLLEELDDNVDDLEEVLAPILESTVVESSKKLPVLDKAKFHVMVTYALESLIFSYLRLHGVNARDHPVFRELTRVKQYFAKIKALETEPEQRPMTLDKEAAGRFIKHGLAGNDKLDLERKEQQAKEKARAHLKALLLARDASATPETSSKNTSSDSDSGSSSDSGPDSDAEETTAPQVSQPSKPSSDDSEKTRPSSGELRKKKKKKVNSDRAADADNDTRRNKLKARRNERRKKRTETRKARKAA